ncbi:MAG: hypothetical protein HY900_18915 [Deltaproteobacteria bacterium]|nr:hypothetical protein [Deltaproteobacteria bacterium]
MRPGENGTKGLLAEFGESLVCVRYRCDPKNRKRYKTVELIVAESPWDPPPDPEASVQLRVAWVEEELRKRVKEFGGRWRPETKTWELPRRVAKELGLEDRIIGPAGS